MTDRAEATVLAPPSRRGDRLRIAELPDRVRAAVRHQEERSEVLIGWVQMFVVAIFGALYVIAPKTADPKDGMLEPVPLALAGYGLFTLLRLVLAYRRRLPPWFLMLSVAVDVGLLMALIWSFHIQYLQPPTFSLKVPTLIYVFIFIALRALRFDPAFVVAAGVTAALGWAGMLAAALATAPMERVITRNYVEYLTSNHVLLGAEFDKIITILVVTAILAVALARGRRLLVRAVVEGAAARDLSRFFAPEVAQRITAAPVPLLAGQGEARDAAILMVDLRGFTAAAAGLEPAEVIALLAEYQARVVPAIRRCGGSIDKFMGDGVLASFGAVGGSATHAADALRAVDALVEAAAAWSADRVARGAVPMTINAAVATGRIVVGAVGDADRLEYTVIGDAVNLAAKLEKHNKAAGSLALATADAVRLAVAQGYTAAGRLESAPESRVEGVGGPIDLVIMARNPQT